MLATLAASTAPAPAMTSVTIGFISRLHAVGPGAGRGPSVAKNEHPVSASTSARRMRQRHGRRARVAPKLDRDCGVDTLYRSLTDRPPGSRVYSGDEEQHDQALVASIQPDPRRR